MCIWPVAAVNIGKLAAQHKASTTSKSPELPDIPTEEMFKKEKAEVDKVAKILKVLIKFTSKALKQNISNKIFMRGKYGKYLFMYVNGSIMFYL